VIRSVLDDIGEEASVWLRFIWWRSEILVLIWVNYRKDDILGGRKVALKSHARIFQAPFRLFVHEISEILICQGL